MQIFRSALVVIGMASSAIAANGERPSTNVAGAPSSKSPQLHPAAWVAPSSREQQTRFVF